MELKKEKIMPTLIETGEPLALPQFDDEATMLSARPVVPLAAQSEIGGIANSSPLVKGVPLLAMIIVVAVSIGVVCGLALGVRRNSRNKQSVTGPVSASVPEQSAASNATTTAQPSAPAPIVETQNQPATYTSAPPASSATRSDQKQHAAASLPSQPISPTVVVERDKEPPRGARKEEAIGDEHRDGERQKRADRAEPRRHSPDEQSVEQVKDAVMHPHKVERAMQQINRIREIFEGQKP